MLPCRMLIAFYFFGLLSLAVKAENTNHIENMVVTGTLTAKSQIDSPVRTQVLSKDALERHHSRSLKDALENVSGIQLTEIHGKSGYQVSLQGLSSDQVLVLMDGLPVINSTGSTADVSQFSVSTVDRIEVIKGASSSQYGSAAMGGVINLISKTPQQGLAVDLQTDIGSYGKQNAKHGKSAQAGLKHGRALIEGGSSKWRARLHADVTDDQGFSELPKQWAQQGDASQRHHYGARLDWLPSTHGKLWLDGSLYQEDSESRYLRVIPPNKSVPQQKKEQVDKVRIASGGHWQWKNGLRLSMKATHEAYESDTEQFSNGHATDQRHAKQALDYVTAQVDLPYWLRQQWTLGATYQQENLQQILNGVSELNGGQMTRSSQELFAQNDVALTDSFDLLIGARWQDDSDFGQHAVPKASLLYRIDFNERNKLRLRSSFGRGYRVPNLKERHFLFDHSALGYKVMGNPYLKPERSTSWQLGADYHWQEAVQLDINLFYNDVTDLIQTDQSDAQIINGISHFTYTNVGKATTQGVETALQWQLKEPLSLTAAYTYTQAKDVSNQTRLTSKPKHMARLGVDWSVLPKTELSFRHRYQSSELVDSVTGAKSPGWHRIDLRLNQTIGRGFKAFIGVNNILNQQRDFQDANDFSPITGRFVYLGVRYQWQKSN